MQDAYSIRCIPQILGAIKDTIKVHNETVTIELNSVTDNPIFISEENLVLHGGNFQGDSKLNNGLPAFLQQNQTGLQSGFMGAQVTATALLAWIRTNAIPSSIQSISTNANNQDVVSMGTISALKTSECIDRVFEILAIEAMILTQAFELKNGFQKASGFSKHSIKLAKEIRKYSAFLINDRSLSKEINTISQKMKSGLLHK